MKKLSLLIGISIYISCFLHGQTKDSLKLFNPLNSYSICELLDSAAKAYVENDNEEAIYLLTHFTEKYPDDVIIDYVFLRLGELYIATNNEAAAATIFNNLIKTPYQRRANRKFLECAHHPDIQKMLPVYTLHKVKYNACLELSKMAMQHKKYEKALAFLNIGGTKCFPKTDCGNDYNSLKTDHAIHLAHCFLVIRDTTSAINALFDWALNQDGAHAQSLLTELLQIQYTSNQIQKEIEKGIEKATFKINKEGELVPTYQFFGHHIYMNWLYSIDDEQDLRDWLKGHKYLKNLKTSKK